MKRIKLVAISIAMFSILGFSSCVKTASSSADNLKPNISVTNTSVVRLTADTVSFDVTIRERGVDVEEITSKGNIRVNKIKTILKNLDVKNITTSTFKVTPYYAYSIIDKDRSIYDRDNERQEYRYHEYLHILNVKINDVDKNPKIVGDAIDAILSVDNAEISGIGYSISDNRKANKTVRKLSAEVVMKKIKSYAEGAGATIKNIRNIREGSYTRDTAVTLAAPLASRKVASENLYSINSDALSLEEAKDWDDSTQIVSDKISFSAEVNYSSILNGNKENTLDVSGYAQVKTDPDIADFSFTVRLEGDSTADLARKGANIVKGICSKLDGQCDMSTVSYELAPFFIAEDSTSSAYHFDRANKIEYYTYYHTIKVRVRDFNTDNKLGKVIDLISQGSGDYISFSTPSYSISDNSQYTAEARKNASANGKERCEIYAEGAGAKCTGVFSIRENYSTQDSEVSGDELYYGASGKKIYKGEDIKENQTVIFRDSVTVHSQLTVVVDI